MVVPRCRPFSTIASSASAVALPVANAALIPARAPTCTSLPAAWSRIVCSTACVRRQVGEPGRRQAARDQRVGERSGIPRNAPCDGHERLVAAALRQPELLVDPGDPGRPGDPADRFARRAWCGASARELVSWRAEVRLDVCEAT